MDDATRKEIEAILQLSDSRATLLMPHQRRRLLAIIEEQERMLKRWKYAVEGLTPNGSEYVDDPEACAAAIRERTRWPKQIIELRARVEEQEREIVAAREEGLHSANAHDARFVEVETARRNAFDEAIGIAKTRKTDSDRSAHYAKTTSVVYTRAIAASHEAQQMIWALEAARDTESEEDSTK